MRVVVAQKGARDHFLTARALHRRGMLVQLVTDWYAPRWSRGLLPLVPGRLSALRQLSSALACRCDELPDQLVRPNRICGLVGKWTQATKFNGQSLYDKALRADMAFIKTMGMVRLPPHDVFLGYSYMSLELLEAAKKRGVFTVLDQIDPGPVHFRLVAEEMKRHPDLAGPPESFPQTYYERLYREWELSDVLVVNSDWSREALISAGADPGKIEVLPLAYEGKPSAQEPVPLSRPSPTRPLRVLWLGQVVPGKGIYYMIEAARQLIKEPVCIDVVGPVTISPGAVAGAPQNITFHGRVSRDRAVEWYEQADVFVLPTLSDGFALTQLESLAHGVPVIATPNCARIVEEGKTGFIIPPRNSEALANAILRFVQRPGLAGEMRSSCREAVRRYSVDSYAKRLIEIIERRRSAHGAEEVSQLAKSLPVM
jgi:glycosyltransferase involved in cell wall biosynthesis